MYTAPGPCKTRIWRGNSLFKTFLSNSLTTICHLWGRGWDWADMTMRWDKHAAWNRPAGQNNNPHSPTITTIIQRRLVNTVYCTSNNLNNNYKICQDSSPCILHKDEGFADKKVISITIFIRDVGCWLLTEISCTIFAITWPLQRIALMICSIISLPLYFCSLGHTHYDRLEADCKHLSEIDPHR